MNSKISIVIPVYNSQGTIEELIVRIEKSLKEYEYEIILVNDGSKDNTAEICADLVEKHKNIIFINLSKNFGQHNALIAGMNYVSGQYVITMDDDLQNPPEEIMRLIGKLKQGYDVVYAKYQSKKHSKFRNLGSRVNDKMANILLKKPSNIYFASFRAIRRYIVDEIVKYEGPFCYIDGLIVRATSNITYEYVKHNAREQGTSNYNFVKLVKLWMNGFINFSVVPLRIATFTGVAMGIIGFIAAIILIVKKVIYPNIPMGWTSLIVVTIIFSGVQLISIGLVGEYIGRTFLSINKMPQFVVKEIKNSK